MPRGPLPNPHAKRRNPATIPTTELPLDGFAGPYPDVPEWVTLGEAGRQYWDWAWRTPEAAAWGTNTGAVDAVARRASFEDDLAAIEMYSRTDLRGLLEQGFEGGSEHFVDVIESTFRVLGKLAGGKLAIVREASKLEDALGLNPKARAQLRWAIKGEALSAAPSAANAAGTPPPEGGSARQRFTVVSGGGA